MSEIAKRPEFKARYENYIGGKFVPPVKGEYFDNVSPIDGKVFTQALVLQLQRFVLYQAQDIRFKADLFGEQVGYGSTDIAAAAFATIGNQYNTVGIITAFGKVELRRLCQRPGYRRKAHGMQVTQPGLDPFHIVIAKRDFQPRIVTVLVLGRKLVAIYAEGKGNIGIDNMNTVGYGTDDAGCGMKTVFAPLPIAQHTARSIEQEQDTRRLLRYRLRAPAISGQQPDDKQNPNPDVIIPFQILKSVFTRFQYVYFSNPAAKLR